MAPNASDQSPSTQSADNITNIQNFKKELLDDLTNVIRKEVVGDLTHLIKKESSRQLVGLTRIADHLQINETVDDIDCFPILTQESLLSLDAQLKDNKIVQAQVVSI